MSYELFMALLFATIIIIGVVADVRDRNERKEDQ